MIVGRRQPRAIAQLDLPQDQRLEALWHINLPMASIWRFPCFAALERLGVCKRHLVYQGRLGAIAWKPPNFFGVRMDDFESTCAQYARETAPGELITLVGKDSSGSLPHRGCQGVPAAHV